MYRSEAEVSTTVVYQNAYFVSPLISSVYINIIDSYRDTAVPYHMEYPKDRPPRGLEPLYGRVQGL